MDEAVLKALDPRPVWAAGAHLNEIPKIVFSKTLQHADWARTRVARRSTSTRRCHDPVWSTSTGC